MSSGQNDKPKTLVSGTKGRKELNCNDLRDYSPPSEVIVYKIINGEKVQVGTQPPTFFEDITKNYYRKNVK